jgi:hypothetical protein
MRLLCPKREEAIDDFYPLYASGCYELPKSHPIFEAMEEKLNEMH